MSLLGALLDTDDSKIKIGTKPQVRDSIGPTSKPKSQTISKPNKTASNNANAKFSDSGNSRVAPSQPPNRLVKLDLASIINLVDFTLERAPRFDNSDLADGTLIGTEKDCRKAISELERHKIIAVDCEWSGGTPITARDEILALVQIANSTGKVYFFDVSVAGDNMFEWGLRRLLEAPNIVKVFHDCRGDSDILRRVGGVRLVEVFDTQIAYAVFQQQRHNFLPLPCGLNTVLIRFANGFVNKWKDEAHAMMEADSTLWLQRPLSQLLLDYARADVSELINVYRQLDSYLTLPSKQLIQQYSTEYVEQLASLSVDELVALRLKESVSEVIEEEFVDGLNSEAKRQEEEDSALVDMKTDQEWRRSVRENRQQVLKHGGLHVKEDLQSLRNERKVEMERLREMNEALEAERRLLKVEREKKAFRESSLIKEMSLEKETEILQKHYEMSNKKKRKREEPISEDESVLSVEPLTLPRLQPPPPAPKQHVNPIHPPSIPTLPPSNSVSNSRQWTDSDYMREITRLIYEDEPESGVHAVPNLGSGPLYSTASSGMQFPSLASYSTQAVPFTSSSPAYSLPSTYAPSSASSISSYTSYHDPSYSIYTPGYDDALSISTPTSPAQNVSSSTVIANSDQFDEFDDSEAPTSHPTLSTLVGVSSMQSTFTQISALSIPDNPSPTIASVNLQAVQSDTVAIDHIEPISELKMNPAGADLSPPSLSNSRTEEPIPPSHNSPMAEEGAVATPSEMDSAASNVESEPTSKPRRVPRYRIPAWDRLVLMGLRREKLHTRPFKRPRTEGDGDELSPVGFVDALE